MGQVRQYRNPFRIKDTPQWLVDQRRRSGMTPYPHLDFSQPCKSGQPFVRADGSCLRCGADQGVAGPKEACQPTDRDAALGRALSAKLVETHRP